MFQFPGFALKTLCIQVKVPGSARYKLPRGNYIKLSGGLPHSEIHGSKPILSSPWLIAEYHVLHRLLLPRHPPNALLALDLIQKKTGFRLPRAPPSWLPEGLCFSAESKAYFSRLVLAGSKHTSRTLLLSVQELIWVSVLDLDNAVLFQRADIVTGRGRNRIKPARSRTSLAPDRGASAHSRTTKQC